MDSCYVTVTVNRSSTRNVKVNILIKSQHIELRSLFMFSFVVCKRTVADDVDECKYGGNIWH